MKGGFRIRSADHTGITVADLDRSLAFWQGVLGFQLSHRAHHTGELASEVTGVSGAEISIAVLQAPGHRIELLEYHRADGTTKTCTQTLRCWLRPHCFRGG